MTQATRTAKSGNKWTHAELIAYNISVMPTSPSDFFDSVADPSLDHLDPGIFAPDIVPNANLSDCAQQYLLHLDNAIHSKQASAIVDFVAETLSLLRFGDHRSTVATRYPIHLSICGEDRFAQSDVCVVYRPDTILMVLAKDKRPSDQANTEPHVIAQAIAAYQYNNTKRAARGKSVLEAMTIPCITMHGTLPTFYLVPVTNALSDAVRSGQYPTARTQVSKCVIAATDPMWLRNGMADPEYRKLVLKGFLAFKAIAKGYWQQFTS